jgi:hypothetical protein
MEEKGSLGVLNSSLLEPFLIPMNPFHNIISYFLKVRFNIINPPTLRFSKWFLFSYQFTVLIVHFMIYPCFIFQDWPALVKFVFTPVTFIKVMRRPVL